jgi:hypothetical protein
LFTPCTHRQLSQSAESVASRHAPEGQSARTVLLRRQSWRGGSGAVALRGEGGWSRQRSEPCGRRCLAPGARPDPFSLARLEGARTASVPGVHPAGHRFPGVRPPGPQARAREELQRPKTWARPRVLRVRAAVRSGTRARARRPRAFGPGPERAWAGFPPGASGPPCHLEWRLRGRTE